MSKTNKKLEATTGTREVVHIEHGDELHHLTIIVSDRERCWIEIANRRIYIDASGSPTDQVYVSVEGEIDEVFLSGADD